MGEIAVAKPPGEPFSKAETTLLQDLASHAGLVFHNLRLNAELQDRLREISARAEELQASRQRIVTAADVERQRLERELHQGTQKQLQAIAARLEEAERLLAHEPDRAIPVLGELTAETNRALEGLRELARGVFPPLLADRGLVPALEAHVRRLSLTVDVEANAEVASRRFDSQVEAAAYFCCVEALRGAEGPAVIQVAADDATLEFSIAGLGHDAGQLALRDMQDRIEARDGSMGFDRARLSGRIPLSAA